MVNQKPQDAIVPKGHWPAAELFTVTSAKILIVGNHYQDDFICGLWRKGERKLCSIVVFQRQYAYGKST